MCAGVGKEIEPTVATIRPHRLLRSRSSWVVASAAMRRQSPRRMGSRSIMFIDIIPGVIAMWRRSTALPMKTRSAKALSWRPKRVGRPCWLWAGGVVAAMRLMNMKPRREDPDHRLTARQCSRNKPGSTERCMVHASLSRRAAGRRERVRQIAARRKVLRLLFRPPSQPPAGQSAACGPAARRVGSSHCRGRCPSLARIRRVILRIIGAGFGRTGTLSTKAALEELGYGPCYHMVDVFQRLADLPVWLDATAGKPVDWKALFKDFQATVDWPGCSFYKDLMKVYPEAKVILNVRDPESWYASTLESIYAAGKGVKPTSMYARLTYGLMWDGTFGGKFEDKAHALDVFARHNEDVKKHVPADRLLVFEVKEGWEPLCKFLGVPAPSKPFPRLNDRESLKNVVRRLVAAGHPAFQSSPWTAPRSQTRSRRPSPRAWAWPAAR